MKLKMKIKLTKSVASWFAVPPVPPPVFVMEDGLTRIVKEDGITRIKHE